MAWRWKNAYDAGGPQPLWVYKAEDAAAAKAARYPQYGYCGMAGDTE
jgi:hypothetical protein